MAQETISMTPAAAASLVGIIGIFNGGGRIVWSTISDFLGRAQTYILFFIMEIIAFYLLSQTNSALTFQILILSCRPLWYMPTLYHSRPYPNSLGLSRHYWSHDCIVLSRSRIWVFHGFSVLCRFICIKYNNCYNLKNVWQEGPSQLTPTFKHENTPLLSVQ